MNDAYTRLQRLGVTPHKSRGQNFLVDQDAIHRLLEFARPAPRHPLVEIGPGLGALTDHLVHFGPLTVIEIEEQFARDLKARLPEVTVIQADVRSVDFTQFPKGADIYGNLPYSFSTEILFHLLTGAGVFRRAVIMLQKEFVQRIAAEPGSRAYSALSVAIQRKATTRLGPIIDGSSFLPETKVQSQVIEITFRDLPPPDTWEELWIERVVRAAFSERRRKLINSLTTTGLCTAEVVRTVCHDLGIDENVRAESISVTQFESLAKGLRSLMEREAQQE